LVGAGLLIAAVASAVSGGLGGLSASLLVALLVPLAFGGRGKPMACAALITLPFAVGGALAARWRVLDLQGWTWPGQFTGAQLTGFAVAAPLLIALLSGAAFSEGRAPLLAGVPALGGAFALGYPLTADVLPFAAGVVCYFALVSRVVQGRWGGNLLDVVCGSVLGGFLGLLVGALLGVFCMMVFRGADPSSGALQEVVSSTFVLGGGVAGSVLGGIRLATTTRQRRSAS
jgi:hypothetical protein